MPKQAKTVTLKITVPVPGGVYALPWATPAVKAQIVNTAQAQLQAQLQAMFGNQPWPGAPKTGIWATP